MYSLILTIILAGNFPDSNAPLAASVTQVNGFTTNEQCMTAANAWVKQQRTGDKTQAITRYTALCVKL